MNEMSLNQQLELNLNKEKINKKVKKYEQQAQERKEMLKKDRKMQTFLRKREKEILEKNKKKYNF
jgi:hypothetical protein